MKRFGQPTGFTLIEIVALLLLVGVLAAVAVPRVFTTGGDALAEADRLRANLRYAQSLAMAGNTASWSVQINERGYTLLRNGQPSPVPLPDENGPARTLAPRVRITGGAGLLALDDMGAPASTALISLSDGSVVDTVTVTGFTGLIP